MFTLNPSLKKQITSYVLVLICGLLLFGCKDVNQTSEKIVLEESIKIEKYRPQFHFTPKEKWMNDPNGLVYNNGTYHLFYQYYPDSTVWGPMHWGHAKSKDLLTWKHRPIALYPDSLGYIFSGSAVIDNENTAGFGKDAMVAIYTYHDPVKEKAGQIDYQTQGIAYSLDDGETWTKYKGNPVISNPGIRDFRDPKVSWYEEKEAWQMVLVAKDEVQFYESKDLKAWEKISTFRFDDKPPLGVWECPDLFQLKVEGTEEEKWVLIVSHGGNSLPNGGSGTRYFVGDYDGTTFTTDQKESQWIDYGTDNYAGVTYNNEPNGKRIFIGWMSNWNYATTTPTEKWRSAMTLPRELQLIKIDNKYLVKSKLVDGFEAITEDISKEDLEGNFPTQFQYTDLQQSIIAFNAKINNKLQIQFSNSEGDTYSLGYEKAIGKFYTNRTNSGNVNFNENFAKSSYQTMPIGIYNNMKVTIILDASSIEIFINDGEYVMTNQIFPNSNFTKFEVLKENDSKIDNLNIRKVATIL